MTDEQIINSIEKSEGWPKYTNDPSDFGGPTKGGITLDTLRAWRNNSKLTEIDLQALERSEARAIYQFMYVQPFFTIQDQKLRHYLIDLGVLRGPRKSIQMMQEIIGVVADGYIGPKTLTAARKFEKHLLAMIIGSRFTHIEARVRDVPSQKKYRDGWRNRNESFLREA